VFTYPLIFISTSLRGSVRLLLVLPDPTSCPDALSLRDAAGILGCPYRARRGRFRHHGRGNRSGKSACRGGNRRRDRRLSSPTWWLTREPAGHSTVTSSSIAIVLRNVLPRIRHLRVRASPSKSPRDEAASIFELLRAGRSEARPAFRSWQGQRTARAHGYPGLREFFIQSAQVRESLQAVSGALASVGNRRSLCRRPAGPDTADQHPRRLRPGR